MPRNVRNFWLSGRIDGRDTPFASGPVSKDGGFDLTVFMRRDGEIATAVTIRGHAQPDGSLELRVSPGQVDVDFAHGETMIMRSQR